MNELASDKASDKQAKTTEAKTKQAKTKQAKTKETETKEARTVQSSDEARASIEDRWQPIRSAIPNSVRLVAVTKTFEATIVRAAYELGLREFGENKVQEALEKQEALSDLTDVTWHFIGHVQSNKSRKVVEHFDWIHSVDSLKLAKRFDRQAAELDKSPKCCLQVKLAPDPTKDGFEIDELKAVLPELDKLTHIQIRGLMTILPYGLERAQAIALFERAEALRASLQQQSWQRLRMDELSMGMSSDFEMAIAAGATIVRIGSGLFGRRR